MTEPLRDLLGWHAGRQQLAGAPIARGGRQRGGHEVARAAPADEGMCQPAARLRQGKHLVEDVARRHPGGVQALVLRGSHGHSGRVLADTRQLHPDRVGRDLADDARLLQRLSCPLREQLRAGCADQTGTRLDRLARVRGTAYARHPLRPEFELERRHRRAAVRW